METRRWSADPSGIAAAAESLREGRLVAFPTETVYGLGADATNGSAVAAIYEAKGRPSFNPLIAHVADLESAQRYGVFGSEAMRLAETFWPGPLTLVVRAQPDCGISSLARAGLDSVALRVPAHPIAAALLREVGLPIAAPSANRSGRISPTTAEHVATDLGGRIDGLLAGDRTDIGVESTIVACDEGRISLLRPGGLVRCDIERVLRRPMSVGENGKSRLLAPGMMESHYAPQAGVRLDAVTVADDEAVLDFGGRLAGMACRAYLDLAPDRNLRDAAANLFDYLHRLDAFRARCIAVAPVPSEGLGEAIIDRLRRAAAPRL